MLKFKKNGLMVFIADRKISKDDVFIVAELSANHSKDLEIALKTLEAVAEAGADAIKLQTVDPNKITIDCDNKYFKMPAETAWAGQSLYDLEVATFLPKEWHKPLFDRAKELNIICFSAPFDTDAIDFLEDLNCPAYKIASFEITDLELISKAARTQKPIIISTGIAEISDIKLAVETCKKVGNHNIILLKCTSAYPTPMEEVDLLSMQILGDKFDCLYGLSDHTIGNIVPLASLALGSSMIEKHVMLDKNIESADNFFSMTILEFTDMVKDLRLLQKALGKRKWNYNKSMKSGRKMSRSLFVTEDIEKNEIFTKNNLRSIRPGYGLHPKFLPEIIGKKASSSIKKGTPFDWDLVNK